MNKQYRREIKNLAKELGIKTVQEDMSDDSPDVYNGATIAYRFAVEGPACKMLEVAVSYCAVEDEFIPKIGKTHARAKLINGQFVTVPLAALMRDDKEWGESILRSMFIV